METINPGSILAFSDAFILVCSTACIVYVLTKHYSFAGLRVFADAMTKNKNNIMRCSLCLGLWIGLFNGVALIGSRYLSGNYYTYMVCIDTALTVALLVFIINVLINSLNVAKRNQGKTGSRKRSS